jgi:hypothetical protein
MPNKIRVIIVSIIILLGGALFSYCAFSYPVKATAKAQSSLTTGIDTNKETPRTGKGRNKSSQNNKIRSKGRSGPKAGAI